MRRYRAQWSHWPSCCCCCWGCWRRMLRLHPSLRLSLSPCSSCPPVNECRAWASPAASPSLIVWLLLLLSLVMLYRPISFLPSSLGLYWYMRHTACPIWHACCALCMLAWHSPCILTRHVALPQHHSIFPPCWFIARRCALLLKASPIMIIICMLMLHCLLTLLPCIVFRDVCFVLLTFILAIVWPMLSQQQQTQETTTAVYNCMR